MSSGKSQYLSQRILNQLNGGGGVFAATLYLALYSVTPSAGSAGTEATGTGYARVSITGNTTNWPTISGSTTTMTSGAAFTFPTATGNWSSSANLTGAALLDASSAGNMYYFGDLTTAKPVLSGDTAGFASGAITIAES